MTPLRVATFNTLFPNALALPGTWTRRSELIRRAIERARADVIGLQEVLPATLAELPRLLGGLSFVAGPDRGPARAFSPYPLLESTLRLVRTGSLRAESCERISEREGTLYPSDHHLTIVEFTEQ